MVPVYMELTIQVKMWVWGVSLHFYPRKMEFGIL